MSRRPSLAAWGVAVAGAVAALHLVTGDGPGSLSHAAPWGLLRASHVFWLGIAHGGVLAIPLLRAWAPERPHLAHAARLTALAGLVGGAAFALLDLGKPLRLVRLLPTPGSHQPSLTWLSAPVWEAASLALLTLLLVGLWRPPVARARAARILATVAPLLAATSCLLVSQAAAPAPAHAWQASLEGPGLTLEALTATFALLVAATAANERPQAAWRDGDDLEHRPTWALALLALASLHVRAVEAWVDPAGPGPRLLASALVTALALALLHPRARQRGGARMAGGLVIATLLWGSLTWRTLAGPGDGGVPALPGWSEWLLGGAALAGLGLLLGSARSAGAPSNGATP